MALRTTNRTSRRAPLNLRTTDELRAKLENSAQAAGRNLTQETELRLERSFELPEIMNEVADRAAERAVERLLAELAPTLRKDADNPVERASDEFIRTMNTVARLAGKEVSPETVDKFARLREPVIAQIVEQTGVSREEAEEKLARLIQHVQDMLPVEEDIRYRKTKSRRRQKPVDAEPDLASGDEPNREDVTT